MKTLSVKQPWATLLTYGISDTENRSWPANYKGKILIHASSTKVTKTFFDKAVFEQANEIFNEMMFGNIPLFENMEYSAIIGYVTVKGEEKESTSVWALPVDHPWQIEDAFLFDEPIRNVKGKLRLYDTTDIDENNLPPAHKVIRRAPKLEGDCLVIPINEADLDVAIEQKTINLCATDEIVTLVERPLDEQKAGKGVFKPIHKVRFEGKQRDKTFTVDGMGYYNWIKDDGTNKKVINWNMEEIEYYDLGIMLKE